MLDSQIYLKKIKFINFRNLTDDVFEFNKKINLVYGNNGNGKTNLLEGIYFSINKKSFKKKINFEQLLSVESEKPEIIINTLFEKNHKLFSTSGKLSIHENTWYEDNIQTKKKISLSPIFINPHDSYQFHTSSVYRREWLDEKIVNFDNEYKKLIKNYSIALKQKNKLLQLKLSEYKQQVQILNEIISETSEEIIKKRINFLIDIKEYIIKAFFDLFDQNLQIDCEYKSKFKYLNKQEIFNYYQENKAIEEIMGRTKYGIHLDDFLFSINGLNSFEYSSLGQQKMSFLSLIFAYIELFRYKFRVNPIVLIDDVSGELDSTRWNNLIEYLNQRDFQVIITTANENFKNILEKSNQAKGIKIEKGRICSNSN
jgi:DNA replication and repair protein RecF